MDEEYTLVKLLSTQTNLVLALESKTCRASGTASGEVITQGVVTYTSPVEAFATGIKNFDL